VVATAREAVPGAAALGTMHVALVAEMSLTATGVKIPPFGEAALQLCVEVRTNEGHLHTAFERALYWGDRGDGRGTQHNREEQQQNDHRHGTAHSQFAMDFIDDDDDALEV